MSAILEIIWAIVGIMAIIFLFIQLKNYFQHKTQYLIQENNTITSNKVNIPGGWKELDPANIGTEAITAAQALYDQAPMAKNWSGYGISKVYSQIVEGTKYKFVLFNVKQPSETLSGVVWMSPEGNVKQITIYVYNNKQQNQIIQK